MIERRHLVRDAARVALDELDRHAVNSNLTDRGNAVEASVSHFIEGLGELLPDDRTALRSWIERYHADEVQRVRWEVWGQVLSNALTDHAFAADRGLPDDLVRAIRQAAVPRLGRDAWRVVDEARAQAQATSLDASDAALLRLEVSQIGDEPYIDVADYMEYLVGQVRARAAVEELNASLSEVDRRRLTDWAVAVARWRGRSEVQTALLRGP